MALADAREAVARDEPHRRRRAMRTFSTAGASMSAVTLGSSVLAESVTGVRSRLASVPTMAASASTGSSARPSFSGTTTGRRPTIRIAASRYATSPRVMGSSARASARRSTLAWGVTSVPNAQTARRRKPRIGRKPSVLPCASATAPRQSTLSARSEGRTRNFWPVDVHHEGHALHSRLAAFEPPHRGSRREPCDVDTCDLDARRQRVRRAGVHEGHSDEQDS